MLSILRSEYIVKMSVHRDLGRSASARVGTPAALRLGIDERGISVRYSITMRQDHAAHRFLRIRVRTMRYLVGNTGGLSAVIKTRPMAGWSCQGSAPFVRDRRGALTGPSSGVSFSDKLVSEVAQDRNVAIQASWRKNEWSRLALS